MPETPIPISPRPGWNKHALERRKLEPLDLSDTLDEDVQISSVDEIIVTLLRSGNAAWEDVTREFVDDSLPDPQIEDGTVLNVWMREAQNEQEQMESTYTAIVRITLSDDQTRFWPIPLVIDQDGRVTA